MAQVISAQLCRLNSINPKKLIDWEAAWMAADEQDCHVPLIKSIVEKVGNPFELKNLTAGKRAHQFYGAGT